MGQYKELLEQTLKQGKEYAIWGIPKGKKSEELLYTKSKNKSNQFARLAVSNPELIV